ncbi:MAG: hypothetical protein RL664_655, partial [Bacteroidota bacterium]
ITEAFIIPNYFAFSLLPFIVLLVHAKKVMLCANPVLLDVELKKVALSTFAIALLIFIFLPDI